MNRNQRTTRPSKLVINGDYYDKELHERLDKLYDKCGGPKSLTRTEFAKFLGVSYASYCNWRNGTTQATDSLKHSVEVHLMLSKDQLSKLVQKRL